MAKQNNFIRYALKKRMFLVVHFENVKIIVLSSIIFLFLKQLSNDPVSCSEDMIF